MADVVAELEAAFISAGTLLVWAEKYRHADPGELPGLRRRALALGDQARALARAGALEERAARELLGAVADVNRTARRSIDDCRASAPYRQAVEARAAGDLVRMTELLPAIFADLEAAGPPAAAFWTPAWQRRGRPLGAAELAAELSQLAAEGIAATGDDLSPGVDPELPGVLLATTDPLGAPVALRYAREVLPDPSLRLGDDQVLIPSDRLHRPFVVVLAPPDEPFDEWVADPATYLRALERACRAQGLTVGR